MRKKVDSNLPKDSSPKKREEVKETKGPIIKSSSDPAVAKERLIEKWWNAEDVYSLIKYEKNM